MRPLLLMFMFVVCHSAVADGLYRWVDNQGKVHYGDIPTEDADRLNLKVFGEPSASAVEDANLPYQTRVARQNSPVTLYVTKNCTTTCQEARDFLAKHNIPYSESAVNTQKEFDDFKKESGLESFPAISIGKTWLQGFSSGQWLDALEVAGYPK